MTTDAQTFDLQAYYAALPKKRTAAAALISNGQGKFLFVELSYAHGWVLPGGSTDKDETPLQTVIREVREEVGLTIAPARLLAIGFYNKDAIKHDITEFGFYAEIDANTVVTIDNDEIVAYHWATIDEAMPHLGAGWIERVKVDVHALTTGRTVWFENGVIVS